MILPEGVSATPGRVRLWPFQNGIADAIGDPMIERVTVLKPVRVGYSMLLSAAVAGFIGNDPGPVLMVLPTEADARGFVVDDLEPAFAASPALASVLADDRDESERNTLTSRRFPGGSLKVVAARSPRNLRRHNMRYLLLDEIDAMEQTAEGSPIALAERRTLSFADRKIIAGSTPTFEETSHVLKLYAASDMRVYRVPCPDCGAFSEILWSGIIWDEGQPETARWRCPHCAAEIAERHKPEMVAAGHWHPTRPEVQGHAGFKLTALISPHANASWAKLAAEFLAAKDDPSLLQVFTNTVLAEGWRSEGEELDESALAGRAEAIGLEPVPEEVLAITAGVDVQRDRLEAVLIGWTEAGAMLALHHAVIWGAYDAEETWLGIDTLLTRRFPHTLGGRIGIDACAIDAGDGVSMPNVMAFCGPRFRRRVVAIKGAPGASRAPIERASKAKGRAPLWIVGVDGLKTCLFARLPQAGAVRFSDALPPVWFEQLASERAVVRYSRGQPIRSFERIPGRRAEALDAVIYAMAARQLVQINPDQRRFDLAQAEPAAAPRRPILQSSWMAR
ncbi:phage terminase large subunit family protein [Rhodobacter capsulatus]|nr:phage terminase large subunit family protein [Rhodobacter capsulatus]WER08946.1 phage terminase large subunit family protein [Rhodobacter capsulatus]